MNSFIKGVGIDLCSVSEIKKYGERQAFVAHTFSEREINDAEKAPDKWGFLSDNFAVKEAAFKALAQLLPEKAFDFRMIETIRRPDGSPEIIINSPTGEVLKKAGVTRLLVSITNQGDYAMAEVIAVEDE